MNAGLGTRPSATTFDVEDLATKAWSGAIRVPHFQRGFRWGRQDVVQLFDSIVKGYPVGSLLLWVRPAPAQKIRLGALEIEAPALDKALWVVDGQQRITSLANALHPSPHPADSRFALAYDLSRGEFVPQPATENAETIPLPVLFNLQLLIRWFSDHPEIADQLDQASALTRTIRQFEIPAYLVEQEDGSVLPVIFDRMNNSGRPMRRAEVFHALFAGDDAGQGTSLTINGIAEDVDAERGFGLLDDHTVLRAILARRGPDVMREIRNEFDSTRRGAADFPGESRDEAFVAGRDALIRAIAFLQESAGVPHLAFLPYRYLLVALARVFAHHPDLDPRNTQLLRRWYWRAALVGTSPFRGSSAGAVFRLCSRIRPGDATRSIQDLLGVIDHGQTTLPDLDRFHTNTATGKIVLCALWGLRPRSPRSGQPYDRAALAEALNGRSTASEALPYIIPRRNLSKEMRRWAADRVLLPEEDVPVDEADSMFAAGYVDREAREWQDILLSHCMNPASASLLEKGDANGFLASRQESIRRHLHRFLEGVCEWGFEDTPPLQTLIMDDDDEDEEN